MSGELFPPIGLSSLLPLPHQPSKPDEIIPYLRSLHSVLSKMQSDNARAIEMLNRYRIVMADSDSPAMPTPKGSGAIYVDDATGKAWYDIPTSGAPEWKTLCSRYDSGIDLSGIHDGLLDEADTVADAMTVLDDLDYADISGNDADTDVTAAELEELTDGSETELHDHLDTAINLSGTPTGVLSGRTTVAEAMSYLDGIIPQLYSISGYWQLGDFTNKIAIRGTELTSLPPLTNSSPLQGTTVGAASKDMLELDGSDHVVVGNEDCQLDLVADGTIDAQDNDIETAGDISAGDVTAATVEIDEVLRNTNSKTLADGVAALPFRWFPTTDGDYMSFTCRIVARIEYTISSVTYYYVYQQVMHGHMVRTAAGSGGITIANSKDTAIISNTGSGTFTPVFAISPTGDGTLGSGPYYSFTIGTGTWVSGSITSHIEILDKNGRAITQL